MCSGSWLNKEALLQEMFSVNQASIQKAQNILADFPHLYWILGGSATGKSTICQAIAQRQGWLVYDMDLYIYGRFQPHYTPERHPACTAWFRADNALAWVMNLSWPEFDALNRATNAEYLDLLADELRATNPATPILIDGGFTHPSIVAQVAEAAHIVCLEAERELVIREWNTHEERLAMKGWIYELPNPEAMWQKFLDHDRRMSEVMVQESRALGVTVFERGRATAVTDLAQQITDHFKF